MGPRLFGCSQCGLTFGSSGEFSLVSDPRNGSTAGIHCTHDHMIHHCDSSLLVPLQAVEAALVFDNPHSEFTMEALRASWGQMIAAIMRALNETQNQILIRDSKGLSEEQITEYRKSFNHFDKVGVAGGCGGF